MCGALYHSCPMSIAAELGRMKEWSSSGPEGSDDKNLNYSALTLSEQSPIYSYLLFTPSTRLVSEDVGIPRSQRSNLTHIVVKWFPQIFHTKGGTKNLASTVFETLTGWATQVRNL